MPAVRLRPRTLYKELEKKKLITHKGTIVDARWTIKGGQKYFGYKDHIKADSAYSEEDIASKILKYIENKIIEKGYRNKPLTKTQEKKNRSKSKKICRIEHVFGFMTKSMNQITARCIGLSRIFCEYLE